MSGTKIGGKKVAAINMERHGADFYKRIGAAGGKKGTTGGFWYKKYVLNDIESVKAAGRIGGALSKRGVRKSENSI